MRAVDRRVDRAHGSRAVASCRQRDSTEEYTVSIERIARGALVTSNFAKRLARSRGLLRALRPGMYDIDAIEAINFEQLATVTDRLLLRGRVTKRRLSTNKIMTRPLTAVRPTATQV